MLTASAEVVAARSLTETMSDALFREIRNCILELTPGFQPGSRLTVDQLARRYQVSATPIKDALKTLESRGLVEVRPRRGVYVVLLSQTDIREILAIRQSLEQASVTMCDGAFPPAILSRLERCLKASEAATAINDSERYRKEDAAFHRLFVEAGHNARLVELYQQMLDQLQIVEIYTPRTPNHVRVSLKEHRRLVALAKAGDLRALQEEIGAHWARSTARILDGYGRYIHDQGRVGRRLRVPVEKGSLGSAQRAIRPSDRTIKLKSARPVGN
jgi:DNA-binding GntR family transcriptional regulator